MNYILTRMKNKTNSCLKSYDSYICITFVWTHQVHFRAYIKFSKDRHGLETVI